MSEEQLKAFLEKVKAASDADAVVSLAKEEGFSISVDDLKNAQSELSDEELENAAGGHQPGYAEELSKAMGGLC